MARYTTQDGAMLAAIIYEPLRSVGLFVGLTGGCLYKPGGRKDIDLVLYRNRQESVPVEEAVDTFVEVVSRVAEVEDVRRFGFCTKLRIDGIDVDVLFPEAPPGGGDDYDESEGVE